MNNNSDKFSKPFPCFCLLDTISRRPLISRRSFKVQVLFCSWKHKTCLILIVPYLLLNFLVSRSLGFTGRQRNAQWFNAKQLKLLLSLWHCHLAVKFHAKTGNLVSLSINASWVFACCLFPEASRVFMKIKTETRPHSSVLGKREENELPGPELSFFCCF